MTMHPPFMVFLAYDHFISTIVFCLSFFSLYVNFRRRQDRMTGPWLVLYILYLLPVHGEPVVINLQQARFRKNKLQKKKIGKNLQHVAQILLFFFFMLSFFMFLFLLLLFLFLRGMIKYAAIKCLVLSQKFTVI